LFDGIEKKMREAKMRFCSLVVLEWLLDACRAGRRKDDVYLNKIGERRKDAAAFAIAPQRHSYMIQRHSTRRWMTSNLIALAAARS